jgi:hypothetical protein
MATGNRWITRERFLHYSLVSSFDLAYLSPENKSDLGKPPPLRYPFSVVATAALPIRTHTAFARES